MGTINTSSTNDKERIFISVLGHINDDDDPLNNNEITAEARRETAKYIICWKEMKLKGKRAWI
eukprot:14054618-Ditylum_brightwellii.AAC.1